LLWYHQHLYSLIISENEKMIKMKSPFSLQHAAQYKCVFISLTKKVSLIDAFINRNSITYLHSSAIYTLP